MTSKAATERSRIGGWGEKRARKGKLDCSNVLSSRSGQGPGEGEG